MGTLLVTIAGGEPLSREDIFSIIRGFADCGMQAAPTRRRVNLQQPQSV
jgi:molybdenum cofactor biosynthesis enzyme MoaA